LIVSAGDLHAGQRYFGLPHGGLKKKVVSPCSSGCAALGWVQYGGRYITKRGAAAVQIGPRSSRTQSPWEESFAEKYQDGTIGFGECRSPSLLDSGAGGSWYQQIQMYGDAAVKVEFPSRYSPPLAAEDKRGPINYVAGFSKRHRDTSHSNYDSFNATELRTGQFQCSRCCTRIANTQFPFTDRKGYTRCWAGHLLEGQRRAVILVDDHGRAFLPTFFGPGLGSIADCLSPDARIGVRLWKPSGPRLPDSSNVVAYFGRHGRDSRAEDSAAQGSFQVPLEFIRTHSRYLPIYELIAASWALGGGYSWSSLQPGSQRPQSCVV
jgi:hypothetical protein